MPIKEFSIDFITELPPIRYRDEVVDTFLVIIDRYTKYVFYFAISYNIDAAGLVTL
jgi:hypothetical protein